MGRCSARLMVLGLEMFLCSTTAVLAETHVVGDSKGWGFSVSYDSWATGKAFAAGDALVFKYQPGGHNAVAVSASEHRSCKVGRTAESIYNGRCLDRCSDAEATATGSAMLNLKKGVNYFICGVPGHCAASMKLRAVANL